MGYKGGPNSKAATAKEKKKQQVHEKEAEKQKEKDQHLSEEWKKGSKKISKKELELEKRQQQILEKKEREEILKKEQASIKSYAARNVNDAIDIFKKEEVDKHPERRVKAAFESFQERRLKELKKENPTLRLSQLKEIVWKEFKKSPENPMNQQNAAYNAKPEEIQKLNEDLTNKKLDELKLE